MMKHARISRAELTIIRKGVPRTYEFGKKPGARRPQEGTRLVAYAPRVVEDGVERKREQVDCVIVSVTDQPGKWLVTYQLGGTDERRFLRASPGAVRLTVHPDGRVTYDGDGDYTSSPAAAAAGEPECVPAAYQVALSEAANDGNWKRDRDAALEEVKIIERAIGRLERIGGQQARGELQGLRARLRKVQSRLSWT